MTPERPSLGCPACGPVQLAHETVEVHVNSNDGFVLVVAPCPGCGDLLAARDAELAARLLELGATHRELRRPLPALCRDDLLALHELLGDEDWCARLATGTT